tara:strand:+ start:1427 stop:1687 length:261 start_codon:yes stop_codon:yes gene_type:complete
MAKETHKSRLLAYLQHYGSITSLEAIRDLGNTRLAASIFLLKRDGHNIKTSEAQVPTRWSKEDGSKKTTIVAKYTLVNEEKKWKAL